LTSETRRSILALLVKSGLQVSPDALDYLEHLESPLEIVELVLDSDGSMLPPVLSKDYIESFLSLIPPDTPWDFVIEKSPIESSVGSEGRADDFQALFEDRYDRIKSIYMTRQETQGAISPLDAKRLAGSARVAKRMVAEGMRPERLPSTVVLGMVRSKSLSHSHNVVVELEDLEGSISCIVPTDKEGPKGRALSQKAASLLHDEVVCISGSVSTRGVLVANDVIFPDVPPLRTVGRAKREVYAAFISDLHCGSKEFLEAEFDRFIAWLNGRGVSEADENLVRRTHYLLIAGDMVDGISVYPGQREDLRLTSNVDQYELLARKLELLPPRIKVLCIPGNHDACRQALPKPPVPKAFAGPLYELDQLVMLGDPSQVNIEGVKVLMTHGDSLDDMVTNLPGAKYTDPARAMIELVRKRHLAPVYGGKTELAPLRRDWMVLDTPPDIVHFGHAHHRAVTEYNRIKIINSGTFQSQTEFMRKQGIDPTPGLAIFVNLQTGAHTARSFMDKAIVPVEVSQ
jgi:DNA polymerase II small subunit